MTARPYGIDFTKQELTFLASPMRGFPPPWTVERIPGGFKVIDADGQSLAYVYGNADARHAQIAKGLTLDDARRIASNIAKLPSLLTPTQRRLGVGGPS